VFTKRALALPLLAIISACGGGGGGSASSSPTIIPPTPSPSPSTPDTQTPTPTPSYENIFNMSRRVLYYSQYVETKYRLANGILPAQVVSPATVTFDGDTRAASLNVVVPPLSWMINVSSESLTFLESEMYNPNPGYISFYGDGKGEIILESELGSRYVASWRYKRQDYTSGNVNIDYTRRFYLFGSDTYLDDMPQNGKLEYIVTLKTTPIRYDETVGTAAGGIISLDFDTNRLTGTLIATEQSTGGIRPLVQVTLNISGTINTAENRITGEITSSDSDLRGPFGGRLFGPNGMELGLLIALHSETRGAVGSLVGIKR
jgi:hypothetical protein